MPDDGEPRAEEAQSRDDEVCPARQAEEHQPRIASIDGLAVHATVEMDGRVDSDGDGAFGMDGAGLALGMGANELDGVGIGRVVLLVRGRDDVERDAELLENRPSLGRCRGEDEPHPGFFATQISSLGHFFDHSTENAS